MIQKGKEYGFNFNNHCEEDISLLQQYINKHIELAR
jgi:hypothetical protein